MRDKVVLMLPKRSTSSAPRKPVSTMPRCRFIPMISRKPVQQVARWKMRESARPTGVCSGRILATPISSSGVRLGACVAFARKQATCGKPIPTTTVSPSFNSRAPAAAMISVARTSISVAQRRIGLQACEMFAACGPVEKIRVVGRSDDVFIEIFADAARIARMFDIELEMGRVVVVAAEDRCRISAERQMNHGLDAMRRNNGAFRFAPDFVGINDVFGNDD